jgi:Glutathione S-transferase, N-terminal domain
MILTIPAFAASPDRGQGLARDTRVRWALEEVGRPHEVRLLSFAEMKQPAHLALHPFGKIPPVATVSSRAHLYEAVRLMFSRTECTPTYGVSTTLQ